MTLRNAFVFLALLFGAVLFWQYNAKALSLELKWDAVTTNADGTPLSLPVKYRLYRKTTLEDFKPVWETANTRFTQLAPSLGKTSWYVTAFNANGESGRSNVLYINVERWPHEDDTIPTPTPLPNQATVLRQIGQGPLDE